MGAVEVKDVPAQFDALLERVEKGETILLTRAGRRVARLVPEDRPHDPREVAAALEGLRALREGMTTGGIPLKDMINEGRR